MKYRFCLKYQFSIITTVVLIAFVHGQQHYWIPEELAIPGYDETMDTTGNQVSMLLTHLYPIGWSRDGKLAYIELFDDHGDVYGYINFDFVIKNHKTGETFSSHTDEQEEFPSDTPLDTIWKEHKKLFIKAFEENNITQCKFELKVFPVCSRTDTIDNRLYTHEVDMDSGPYGLPCIDSLALYMESRKHGSEVIYSDTGAYVGIGASVPGYLDDLFGNEIIVLLILSHWGWEGPPNTTTIKLLNYSIKPQK